MIALWSTTRKNHQLFRPMAMTPLYHVLCFILLFRSYSTNHCVESFGSSTRINQHTPRIKTNGVILSQNHRAVLPDSKHPWNSILLEQNKSTNRQICCRISLKGDSDDDTTRSEMQGPPEDDDNQLVLGAALLFAGTAMGAGMLALPAETLDAGFGPSILNLMLCWAFTYITALVTLEATWLTTTRSYPTRSGAGGKEDKDNWEENGGSFLSISQQALGRPGQIITGILFWFLLTAIVVAYTAEAGQLVAQVLATTEDGGMVATLGSAAFAILFGILSIVGTSRVDIINRLFVTGLVVTFGGLVAVGLPQIDAANLLNTPTNSQWSILYPAGISVGILSFGAQNVVPTLFAYLGGNPHQTKRAILWGSVTPLVLYSIWEAVFLGIVPSSSTMMEGDGSDKMQIATVLVGNACTSGTIVNDLVEIFSVCAIGSSMAGASVSLVDFFQDALVGMKSKAKLVLSPKGSDVAENTSRSGSKTRTLSALLALGPPVLLAYAFPEIFLVALEEAGILGAVTLYGILPALSIILLRRQYEATSPLENSAATIMPGRLGGGDTALYALILFSLALVLPEVVRLLGGISAR